LHFVAALNGPFDFAIAWLHEATEDKKARRGDDLALDRVLIGKQGTSRGPEVERARIHEVRSGHCLLGTSSSTAR